MATISRFRTVQLHGQYKRIELWEGQKFLGSFWSMEEVLEFVYDLRRYLPEEIAQMKLEWD